MIINFGGTEWEESRKVGSSSLGKKLAAALTILTLAALALGTWIEAPDLSVVASEAAVASALHDNSPQASSRPLTE